MSNKIFILYVSTLIITKTVIKHTSEASVEPHSSAFQFKADANFSSLNLKVLFYLHAGINRPRTLVHAATRTEIVYLHLNTESCEVAVDMEVINKKEARFS